MQQYPVDLSDDMGYILTDDAGNTLLADLVDMLIWVEENSGSDSVWTETL